MKKTVSLLLVLIMIFTMSACSTATDGGKTYTVGICNYVDDASLNQIVDNIQTQLNALGEQNGITFKVKTENCNADSNVLTQIISDFEADNVDLMVGVATPVAMAMQAATEDSKTPVVFSAVSDPVGTGITESLEAPGSNITGTSDYLDTESIFKLILAVNKGIKKVGFLYDVGQDSSKKPITDAKAFLDANGVSYVEHTGTTVDEISLAADALIADGVEAIFTPTDNTVMKSQLSIYEKIAEAGIPHYAGADSFALNGAFLGYGVDYANLGVETANMVYDVLVNGKDPATLPVKTFDNGTATVNTEICEKLGYDFDEISKTITPFCMKIETLVTAETFDEVK